MLSRLFVRYLIIRTITPTLRKQYCCSLFSTQAQINVRSRTPIFSASHEHFQHFSTSWNNEGNDKSSSDSWKFTPDKDDANAVFTSEDGNLTGISEDVGLGKSPCKDEDDEWKTAEGYKPWSFAEEGSEEVMNVFDVGEMERLSTVDDRLDEASRLKDEALEKEEHELMAKLKGPNRAFGDLMAASGITEAMLDSLIVLKELEGIEGLPPLTEIEDMRLAKADRKSTRVEIERKKQEETAKTYVRKVDEKGRAYGTGRRKCSIARVWIQPGEGKFIVNEKEFDVYFPILDHRAALLSPFAETKTIGLWDVNCTVKGGGVSGQVGAIRLGISRALQNWEPGLRPYLRSAGFLTRDARVVERKKPGKAKARKSFQWVKR